MSDDDTKLTVGSGCAYAIGLLIVAVASPMVWVGLFVLVLLYRFATGATP